MSSNPYNIDVYNAKDALADLEVEVRARLREAEKQIRADMHDAFEAAKAALAAELALRKRLRPKFHPASFSRLQSAAFERKPAHADEEV